MAEPEPTPNETPAAPPAEKAATPAPVADPTPVAAPHANDNPPEPPAPEKKKPFKIKLFEKGVDVAGFGQVLAAWRSPGNRFRNVMKSIGTKAADMVAGRIVSSTFRLIAITWVAGMIGGVSTFGGLALLALATGASSGIYSYGKDYLHDRFYGPKEKRKETKLIDRARAKSAALSFLGGTANGALGAYLAKTGILQHAFGAIKGMFNSAASAVPVPSLSSVFTAAAAPESLASAAAPLPAPKLSH